VGVLNTANSSKEEDSSSKVVQDNKGTVSKVKVNQANKGVVVVQVKGVGMSAEEGVLGIVRYTYM
jgi:hypothetical protein